MQQFILIRGHQGSGKSTFAKETISQFLQKFPDAPIVHVENDLLLTDEHGNYYWTPERLDKAANQGMTMMKNAFKYGKEHPNKNVLVINSNTNQKISLCKHLLALATKYHFKSTVYRLHNFFENIHHVKEAEVLAAYIRLDKNKLKDEIDVAPIRPMTREIQEKIEQLRIFDKKPLEYDSQKHTYISDEYLAFNYGNFTAKYSKNYPNLKVLKYARKVFYNNNFDDALLEMRGLVMDKANNIIIRPFKKVFNYSERVSKTSKYPIDIDDNHLVDLVVKVNGFLGVCTYVDLDKNHDSFDSDFNHQVLYSTTGSLDSDFAKITKNHCQKYESLFKQYPNHTFLFEITDKNDVHIIKEDFGETLIGVINVKTSEQFSEERLNQIADDFNQSQKEIVLKRPQMIRNISFKEAKTLLKTVKHEGFMVFDSHTKELLFKLKSPFYLVSKFLGRSNEESIDRKLNKNHVDEEYYPLIDHIKENKDIFNQLSELDKITFIQNFLEKI